MCYNLPFSNHQRRPILADSIVTGSDYLLLPRSPECWLVEDILPTSGGLLLYGDPKVGKSYAALQLACCLTSGCEWLGFHVPQPMRVVYVQLDTPRTLWAARVEQLSAAGHPVEGVHFADRDTLQTFPFNILQPDHFNLLRDALELIKPGAVIIDTIREAHSGDENDSTEMQEVITHLEAAVKPAASIFVAHARKSDPTRQYDIMNDNRGSNYLVGKMDAICRFSKSSMRVVSRTMEEHSIKLDRADDLTWTLAKDPLKALAEMTLQNHAGKSIRELAKILHVKTTVDGPEKSEEACRQYLMRLQKKLAK